MANRLAAGSKTRLSQSDVRQRGGERLLNTFKDKYKKTISVRRANVIATTASAGNGLVVVGDHPEGFGKTLFWDRADDEILLVLFINAADDMGISVLGLQPNDVVQVTSAAGIASFSTDKGNPIASSIVGLVGVGAKAGLGLAGFPEFIPVINEVEKFAQKEFKATNAKTKRRDAYGVDPSSGHKAKQEGGIVVAFPEAGEPYYSGNNAHKERWIKSDGTRTDDHRPDHVVYGFFPIAGNHPHNTRKVFGANAPLYVLAWDHIFSDNAGFYKVFVHIRKGSKKPPIIL